MKLTEIPSYSVTKEYLLEAFDMRFSFQVFDGRIEHVNDYEIYGWTKGRTMEEVKKWTEDKEKEKIEELKRHKLAVFRHKNRTVEQQEEDFWQIIKNDPHKVWQWNKERSERLGQGQYEEDSHVWEFFDEYTFRKVEDYTEDQKKQMLHEEERRKIIETFNKERIIKGYDYPRFD